MTLYSDVRDDKDVLSVFAFQREYREAQEAMKRAADAMRDCCEFSPRYDGTHKAMVRLIREWNKLEHTRELPPTPDTSPRDHNRDQEEAP